MLLQASENLGLRIVVVAFASKPMLLLTLIEKVIIDIAGTSEMPCQQFGLSLVRVQPELICSVYLSHIAYKVNNCFVNYQIFSYVCGMEKNYNHENRHKYYLKCHLIFCIKYRRKILYGDFDNYIKTNFKSIAGNSDFNKIGKKSPRSSASVDELSLNFLEFSFAVSKIIIIFVA